MKVHPHKKVLRLNSKIVIPAVIGGLLLAVLFSPLLAQIRRGNTELTFETTHRINAHGDEFNALAKSSDERLLFTATEKGEVIVWNTAANRLERTLRQPSPLHLIASLADRNEFVAVGWGHFKPVNALARKWNAATGEFVDLPGLDPELKPVALATETATGLIALALSEGKVLVWDARTHKLLGAWNVNGVPIALALLGRDAYVATVDQEFLRSEETVGDSAIIKLNVDNPQQAPADYLRIPGRTWFELSASPDYRLLRASYQAKDEGRMLVVIDPQSKREIGSFDHQPSHWTDNTKLMFFDWLDPAEVVQVSLNEPAQHLRKFERMESDTRGRAFDLTGQVSKADGTKVWASYRKGPGLVEFDLATNKLKTLIGGPSGAYALSVVSQDGQTGELLTGGADGYVRLWKLDDMSLIKEYKVARPDYFVSDALLVPGSRRAVVAVMHVDTFQASSDDQMPLELLLVDLETGQQRNLFSAYAWRTRIALVDNQIVYAELGRIKFATLEGVKTNREFNVNAAILQTAVSANSRWLAVIDYNKKLTVFDLTTGRKRTMSIKEEYAGPADITNDGRYVYLIGREGSLTTWDIVSGKTSTSVLARIREMHTRADFMTLANDDRWLVIAGNHRDVGIFDRATLKLLFYMQNTSAAHYVEQVWIRGNRMIVTNDTGVVHAGILK